MEWVSYFLVAVVALYVGNQLFPKEPPTKDNH